MRLHQLQGGLRLPGRKQAAATPIQRCPLPAQLWVPLSQHAGPPPQLCVEIGEQVSAGQPLALAAEERALPVHAPCAAEVTGLEERALAHPGALRGLHVGLRPLDRGQLDADGLDGAQLDADRRQTLPRLDPLQDAPGVLRQRLRDAGIAGLGGAGFPTYEKLAIARSTLILNGAECEPYIACDDRLLRERAAEVVAGARLLRRLTGAERSLIAVEDCMTEAAECLAEAIDERGDIELVKVPTVYPQGGERQLIRVLTGREVPLGGLPRDIGVLVLNVATAAAAWNAASLGQPLTHRLVSVAGPGVRNNAVFEVAIGTPIADLIAAAGGYTEQAQRLIVGGPLMGIALEDDSVAISKISNSVLVLGAEQLMPSGPALPCIRCGDCASACPAGLLPQQLFAFAQTEQWQRLREHGLQACIECACCDLVCPSHIPLVQQFRYAKTELRSRELAARRAAEAKQRFEAREQRVQREQREREARMAEKRRTLSSSAAQAEALSRSLSQHDDGGGS